MDVYSMHASAEKVLAYLRTHGDPEAAERAEARYRCFDRCVG
jgi:erythromycin esterase-like protein